MQNNLLVICNAYPDKKDEHPMGIYVKSQLEYLKPYFDKIYVISPIPFGIEYIRKTQYKNYEYDNIYVYFPKYFNFPVFYFYYRNLWIRLEKKAIYKLLEKEKINFNLIHAHFTWPSGIVAIAIKEDFKIPVVITEHASVTFEKAIREKDDLFIMAWKSCDMLIRVRKKDICSLVSVGVPPEKITCIPNGYDHKKFVNIDKKDCRQKLGIPMDRKIILNIGNLYGEVKGHKYLIDSISHVVKQRKDILCIIVGGGKLKNSLENQIRHLGLADYVKLVGGKPFNEIPIWMNACDIFVLPSLNEGNPTVMFECLGCGKPFIGTKVGGIPEIIISEDYGLLVEPENPTDLAEKILIALNKEWDSNKIKIYAQNFTWEKISKDISQIYQKII
jgi:glycosyltransferase involved in cell wall biosynthesis